MAGAGAPQKTLMRPTGLCSLPGHVGISGRASRLLCALLLAALCGRRSRRAAVRCAPLVSAVARQALLQPSVSRSARRLDVPSGLIGGRRGVERAVTVEIAATVAVVCALAAAWRNLPF